MGRNWIYLIVGWRIDFSAKWKSHPLEIKLLLCFWILL